MSGAPVSITSATSDDLEAINDIYNHYVVTSAVTFDVEPRSMAWRWEWFSSFRERGRYRLLAARDGGDVLGYAATVKYRVKAAYETSVETSVYVAPDHTGRGIGHRLYQALFAELEGEDVHRAFAGIVMPNPASVRLHERFGFRRVGYFTEQGRKLGHFWDVAWYERPFPGPQPR